MTAALKAYQPLDMDWSAEQLTVLDRIERWRHARFPHFLTLGGFAGTGKSTVIAHLAETWTDAAVCAFTGKAASVLRQKGVSSASTLHSLMYVPIEDAFGKLQFCRRPFIDARVIIVDEASMVSRKLHNDLMSFTVPILYVGDHGQLEPIDADGLHLMAKPELRLEKIHRQAADNPILHLATAFREGRHSEVAAAARNGWKDRSGRLRFKRQNSREHLGEHVICGFNRTRHAVNQLVRDRRQLRGRLPLPNERLLCLQNNQEWGIYNGQQVTVFHVGTMSRFLELTVLTDDERTITLPCLPEQFGRNKLDHRDRKIALFDFGYCLTAHKAQGSEWDDVTVIEEICDKWDARRWRYTAATRASERLVYCW
jgi:exodeoxyribonuclease-5